jgi:hypothetical protein
VSGQKVHAAVDLAKRVVVRLTTRRELDIHPHVVALPFDYLKMLARQAILRDRSAARAAGEAAAATAYRHADHAVQ